VGGALACSIKAAALLLFFFVNFFLQNICSQVVSGSPENSQYPSEPLQHSPPLIRGHFLSFFVYENCFFLLLLFVCFLPGVEIFQLHHPPTHSSMAATSCQLLDDDCCKD
jgi:hypothetical protein